MTQWALGRPQGSKHSLFSHEMHDGVRQRLSPPWPLGQVPRDLMADDSSRNVFILSQLPFPGLTCRCQPGHAPSSGVGGERGPGLLQPLALPAFLGPVPPISVPVVVSCCLHVRAPSASAPLSQGHC